MSENEMAVETLRWIAAEIRGRFEESQNEMKANVGDEFIAGRALAYQELLDIVKNRAKVFSTKID